MVPSGSDIEQRQAEVKLAWTPSIHTLYFFFSLSFKQVFTSDTLPCTLPNALSSHQHHKPAGNIMSSTFCLQHLQLLSILSHSLRTLRLVSAQKEWRGHSSRGYFTPTGNVNKVSLGPAIGKKKPVEVGCCICKITQPLSLSRPQTTGNCFFRWPVEHLQVLLLPTETAMKTCTMCRLTAALPQLCTCGCTKASVRRKHITFPNNLCRAMKSR